VPRIALGGHGLASSMAAPPGEPAGGAPAIVGGALRGALWVMPGRSAGTSGTVGIAAGGVGWAPAGALGGRLGGAAGVLGVAGGVAGCANGIARNDAPGRGVVAGGRSPGAGVPVGGAPLSGVPGRGADGFDGDGAELEAEDAGLDVKGGGLCGAELAVGAAGNVGIGSGAGVTAGGGGSGRGCVSPGDAVGLAGAFCVTDRPAPSRTSALPVSLVPSAATTGAGGRDAGGSGTGGAGGRVTAGVEAGGATSVDDERGG
jgi:hypothetical protein